MLEMIWLEWVTEKPISSSSGLEDQINVQEIRNPQDQESGPNKRQPCSQGRRADAGLKIVRLRRATPCFKPWFGDVRLRSQNVDPEEHERTLQETHQVSWRLLVQLKRWFILAPSKGPE